MTKEELKAYEEQLNPCPFCGGKAKLYNRFGWWYVACRSLRDICKVDCSTIMFDSPEEAVKVWNKRGKAE